jgi:hypothetical protein
VLSDGTSCCCRLARRERPSSNNSFVSIRSFCIASFRRASSENASSPLVLFILSTPWLLFYFRTATLVSKRALAFVKLHGYFLLQISLRAMVCTYAHGLLAIWHHWEHTTPCRLLKYACGWVPNPSGPYHVSSKPGRNPPSRDVRMTTLCFCCTSHAYCTE